MCATSMRATRPPRAAVAALACAVLMPLLAVAQSAPSREQEQIRRLRQQLQQLQQELATARQGEAGARAESANRVAAAEAAARRAQRGATGTAQRVAELETELTGLRDKLADTDRQLLQRTAERDEARQGLTQSREELSRRAQRMAEGERSAADLLARFRTQNAALDLCSRHNKTLQAVSMELLGRWARHDWRDALLAKEPLVQARRVEIESLVQGYEDRIDAALLPARP
jgi:chromosome segregation ATPase